MYIHFHSSLVLCYGSTVFEKFGEKFLVDNIPCQLAKGVIACSDSVAISAEKGSKLVCVIAEIIES